jgi:hypothetical protein
MGAGNTSNVMEAEIMKFSFLVLKGNQMANKPALI